MGRRIRAGFITLSATGALVGLAFHRPGPLVSNPDDPSSAVVGAAAWLVWALVGYLLAGAAITAIGHLRPIGTPGGRRGSSRTALIACCLTPRVIRRLVDVAVGTTAAVVVATAVGPVAAYADAGSSPAPRPTVRALEWPGLAPAPQHEPVGARPADPPSRASTAPASTARPSTPAAALVTSPARRRGGPPEEIVVRAGDSLWTLTARRLGSGASAAEVAATWPRLYAANRAVIGANPALIHPGQRLVPPATEARSPR